jgi:hypothetical protein
VPAIVVGASVLSLVDAGVFVGVLLVLADNALVGVNLEHVSISGAVNGTDLAFIALFVFAVSRHILRPGVRPARTLSALLTLWAVVFLAVWAVDFVRAVDAGTSYLRAASFGRDFLYYGLGLPFASSLITTDDELRHFCIIVAVLSTAFACADIAASLGFAPVSLANAQHTLSQESLSRVYNYAYYLFEFTFSGFAAYALLHSGRRARLATVLAALAATALLLSFGRALYAGVFLGLVGTFGVWTIGQGHAQRILRRRLIRVIAALAVFGTLLILAAPGTLDSGPVRAVTNRAGSITSAIDSSSTATSTVAYRQRIDSLMFQVLGHRWPAGLGFIPPQADYFVDLPEGSIRDVDLGVVNSVMTMGVIGTILLYLPPVWLLCALIRRSRWRVDNYSQFWIGGMIWLLIALITTSSLGSLASVSGLATITVGCGILITWLSRTPREPKRPGEADYLAVSRTVRS